MSDIDANKVHYMEVEILGVPGLYTSQRVDRATVPPGMYAYGYQTPKGSQHHPCLLGRQTTEHYEGTILTVSPIDLPQTGSLTLEAGALQFCGECFTPAQFERKYLSPPGNARRRHMTAAHVR